MSVFWSNLSYEIKNNAVYSICLFIADSVYIYIYIVQAYSLSAMNDKENSTCS